MAVLRISQPPITSETYDAVNARLLAVRSDPPEGLIMHSASEVNGTRQVVDVWESEEHARRFDTERLTPAVEQVAGVTTPASPPDATIYELHNLLLP